MLTIYRRHLKACDHRSEGREYRRCRCPIWVDGFLGDEEIRKALRDPHDTSGRTKVRDWQRATEIIYEWEAAGQITREPEAEPMTVKEGCAKFEADAAARNLREPTIYKYKLLFRRLQTFADENGLRYLAEFNLDAVRRFRATWTNKNIAARKKLEALKAFFRFAHESRWTDDNPARHLKPPKTTDPPTLPFSRDEFVRILRACPDYPDKANAVRLRALVLLLRHSGLRIRDAVTLGRDRIEGDKLFLFTHKTGTPVWLPVPPSVTQALEAVPAAGPFYFWSGTSKAKSAVGDWQRALKRLFKLAKVEGAHAHRFRHTFAVELLLAGVPMERVSVLLGHQSVRITEKHYAPWIRARRNNLRPMSGARGKWCPLSLARRRGHPGYTAEALALCSCNYRG